MMNKLYATLICSLLVILIVACKKEAICVCTYTEENYSTNVTTTDTYTRKIYERKSAHKKACESPNFEGTNAIRYYNYKTECHLQ